MHRVKPGVMGLPTLYDWTTLTLLSTQFLDHYRTQVYTAQVHAQVHAQTPV